MFKMMESEILKILVESYLVIYGGVDDYEIIMVFLYLLFVKMDIKFLNIEFKNDFLELRFIEIEK